MRRSLSAWLLCAALAPSLAWGDAPPWRSETFSHYAVSEPLPLLLQSFAADQGIPVIISEKVQGTISGQFGPLPPQEFLDRITRANGLVWYYDGSALSIYDSSELASQLIAVRTQQAAEVVESLQQLGILSERYPIRVLPDRGILYVSGPPRYLEVVAEMATRIEEQAVRQATVDIAMEVYPLKYAWADDQVFVIGNSQVAVPGVATILRNLVNGPAAGGPSIGGRFPLPNNLTSLRGTGLISTQNFAIQQATDAAISAEIAAAQANARANVVAEAARQNAAADSPQAQLAAQVQTVVQADSRLNAVVIRDVRERLPAYEKIIRELDRPSGLVQIEAAIIDVDAASGFEWGPPYNVQGRSRSGDLISANFTLNNNPAEAPGNLSVSLTRDAMTQFLASVQALETEGQARLVSRPTVLTINNVEAILDSKEEFFVRIESTGLQQGDLFNVDVGTSLRIIPHIVEEFGIRRVKLIVTIEDGRRTEDEVDMVPVITRNNISTQAVLNEGNSLLIGGLFREETTRGERSVPYLGRIPKVGFLFKSVDVEKRKFERMVLITPRIIDLPDGFCELPVGPVYQHAPMRPYDYAPVPGVELPQPTLDGPAMLAPTGHSKGNP